MRSERSVTAEDGTGDAAATVATKGSTEPNDAPPCGTVSCPPNGSCWLADGCEANGSAPPKGSAAGAGGPGWAAAAANGSSAGPLAGAGLENGSAMKPLGRTPDIGSPSRSRSSPPRLAIAGAAGWGAGAGCASAGGSPSSRCTTKTLWHLEHRTLAPRGPIFSSATLNLAWHWLQTTIMWASTPAQLPCAGPRSARLHLRPLDTKRHGLNNLTDCGHLRPGATP